MKILYAASEAQPFAASGGLADVAGSLPKALAAEGCECSVIMPYYKNTIKPEHQKKIEKLTDFRIPVGWRSQFCGVHTAKLKGVRFYFIDNEYYFKRDFGLYGYYDDAERFAYFSRAVLETVQHTGDIPDIINSNDWQCALIPIYYNIYYRYQHDMRAIKNVFTIHNIQYQGHYGFDLLEDVLSIPRHISRLVEYDGDVNFMKGAIEVADKVTTVSPTYAEEILDPWFSHGLDRALASKKYKTCGFLNGIDTDMYNPATDPDIAANFSAGKKAGKKICKAELLKQAGLPGGDEPVIGIISRMVEHKGFDLIKNVFDDIVGTGYKVVVLGSGDPAYENFFNEAAERFPGKVSFTCGYIPDLAKKIYAGADMFLMPSKSEPCGLAQMISLRYGTVPIVRATGGLKDSIVDCGDLSGTGTGFTFLTYNAGDMLNSVKRAYGYYCDKKAWGGLVTRAMKADFSWKQSAKLYLGLYKELYNWGK
ncbi:MAG: glycogen synthase [Oscillospiraceae bacterium]|jgi:starch synthase|nr:glycogen synthase [Oscillospiraceae bacterium]